MSLTIEQVLDDAKRLVDRLRDHDNAADSLIEQSTTLNKRIEAMKQYQEEVEEMNNVARHRPRSALILGIQQENRQIRELQRENRELRVALEEHQSALDLIMSSYREQVCRMLIANRFDRDCLEKHAEYHENSISSTAKIIEMAAVMKQAIELEEKSSFDAEQQLTRLQVENRGLRELLEISRAVHYRHSPIHQDEKMDKQKDATTIIVSNEGARNLADSEYKTLDNDKLPKVNSATASKKSDDKAENITGKKEALEHKNVSTKEGLTSIENERDKKEDQEDQSEDASALGDQSEDASALGDQSKDVSALVDQSEDVIALGDQSENVSALVDKSKNVSALGDQSKDVSALVDQSEDVSALVDQSEDVSALGDQSKNVSALVDQSEDVSALVDQSEDVRAMVDQSEDVRALVDQSEDVSALGEGVVDLEVENILNDFADMTAGLDMGEDEDV